MESQLHDLSALFRQLGLADTPEAVRAFIRSHGPLAAEIPLHEAPFWNRAQTQLLLQAKSDDADWCEIVDLLDVMLRSD